LRFARRERLLRVDPLLRRFRFDPPTAELTMAPTATTRTRGINARPSFSLCSVVVARAGVEVSVVCASTVRKSVNGALTTTNATSNLRMDDRFVRRAVEGG
jgi:hypothetical protein